MKRRSRLVIRFPLMSPLLGRVRSTREVKPTQSNCKACSLIETASRCLAALEQIAEDINKLQQIKVEVKSEGKEQPLSEEIKLGFFRIAQEALNNARKHARAANAKVYLKYEADRLQMTVSDDGTGFDVQKAKTQAGLKGSLGLVSMQERAKLIAAKIKFESKPGKGTNITVEILHNPHTA